MSDSDATLGHMSVPERLGMPSGRSPWSRRECPGEDGQAGNIRCLAGAERERVCDRRLRLIGGATGRPRSVISIEGVIGESPGTRFVSIIENHHSLLRDWSLYLGRMQSPSAWGCGEG